MDTDSREPLSQREWVDDADITELDYEDGPTRVDAPKARLKRDSLFPPAGPAREDVYSLIERRDRKSLELVDESPIDFDAVLRAPAPPSHWREISAIETAAPAVPAAPQGSSIAPVSMPATHPPLPKASTDAPPPSHVGYVAAIGGLAAVAAAIALWLPARAPLAAQPVAVAAPVAATVDLALDSKPMRAPASPRTLDLSEIRIVGHDVVTAAAPAPATAELEATGTEPRLAASPGKAESPESSTSTSEAPAAESPDTETLAPPEPPVAKAPPFDRSAAATALSVAASQAASCREPGAPSAQTRVSLTFAPTGRVAAANVQGAYAGSSVGSCIAKAFRVLRVDPFDGAPVTVHKTFQF